MTGWSADTEEARRLAVTLGAAARVAGAQRIAVTVYVPQRAGVVAAARAMADAVGVTVTAEIKARGVVVRFDGTQQPADRPAAATRARVRQGKSARLSKSST
jgi:hypothetical protein